MGVKLLGVYDFMENTYDEERPPMPFQAMEMGMKKPAAVQLPEPSLNMDVQHSKTIHVNVEIWYRVSDFEKLITEATSEFEHLALFISRIAFRFIMPYSIPNPEDDLCCFRAHPLLSLFSAAIFLVGCTPPSPTIIPTPTPSSVPATGSTGMGIPTTRISGNGGFDVQHYTITLDVDPFANTVEGSVTITAKALEYLGSFNLDFHGLTIELVTVNNAATEFSWDEDELTITLTEPLEAEPAIHACRAVSWFARVDLYTGWFIPNGMVPCRKWRDQCVG